MSPAPEEAEGPRTPADWVEALVQQMAGAKDVEDARGRASQVLQAFEQAVLQQAARSQVTLHPHSCLFQGAVARLQMLISALLQGQAIQ